MTHSNPQTGNQLSPTYFCFFLHLALTISAGCSSIPKAMQIKKPSYYLKTNIQSCPHVISVNGFEISASYDDSSDNSSFPINPYIRQGKNELEIQLPSEDELKEVLSAESRCEVTISVSGQYQGKEVDFKVADILFSPNQNGEYTKRYTSSIEAGNYKFEGSYSTSLENGAEDAVVGAIHTDGDYYEDGEWFRLNRTFTANVPFPEWAFFSAEKIFSYPMNDDKYNKIKAEMWPLVLELWDLFEEGNTKKILPHFKQRSKEYDLAFYREEGETLQLLKDSIQTNYDEGYPLNRKESDLMQMHVAFNERLISIKNAGSGNGTVMFYYQEADMNIFYDVYWMKIDGKWVIGR